MRWRDAHGAFRNRQQLLDVSGLGAKTFEQCAGFLRIRDGDNPLDQSGVHPETYPVVERLLAAVKRPAHGHVNDTIPPCYARHAGAAAQPYPRGEPCTLPSWR